MQSPSCIVPAEHAQPLFEIHRSDSKVRRTERDEGPFQIEEARPSRTLENANGADDRDTARSRRPSPITVVDQ